jgi:hypothetical protein
MARRDTVAAWPRKSGYPYDQDPASAGLRSWARGKTGLSAVREGMSDFGWNEMNRESSTAARNAAGRRRRGRARR